jgi:hypothetical protein
MEGLLQERPEVLLHFLVYGRLAELGTAGEQFPFFWRASLPLNPPEQRRLFKGDFYSFAVAFHVKNLEGNTTSISLAIMII